jgi:hydroxyethylthiazole kinase-like uncharacterized protein yjeF
MTTIPMNVYNTSAIRALEQLAYSHQKLSETELMERAAKASLKVLVKHWPQAKRVLVVCGAGNNGGDGYLLARAAHLLGLQVTVVHLGEIQTLKDPALAAATACQQAGVEMYLFSKQNAFSKDAVPGSFVNNYDVIVDAILGIGLTGELRSPAREAINAINQIVAGIDTAIPSSSNQQSMPFVLSMDIPSGLETDSGFIHDTAVIADVTVTFLGMKIGLVIGEGPSVSGIVELDALELTDDLQNKVSPSALIIEEEIVTSHLTPRARSDNKGHFGHVLIVGGNEGMAGAAVLAATAAARVGSGLVSVATRPPNAAIITSVSPEVMSHDVISEDEIKPILERSTVVVVGPGLGKSDWAKLLLKAVLQVKRPCVVDADGLNLLSANPYKRADWILTPHPGEAARLLNTSVDVVQSDRLAAAINIQKQYGGVCVLKGAGTIVVGENQLPALCTLGNPGMASGGMGDVLSGVIGGLLAQEQDVSLFDIAKQAVWIHARAGDMAASDGERGMLASDLFPYLRLLVNPDDNV